MPMTVLAAIPVATLMTHDPSKYINHIVNPVPRRSAPSHGSLRIHLAGLAFAMGWGWKSPRSRRYDLICLEILCFRRSSREHSVLASTSTFGKASQIVRSQENRGSFRAFIRYSYSPP